MHVIRYVKKKLYTKFEKVRKIFYLISLTMKKMRTSLIWDMFRLENM